MADKAREETDAVLKRIESDIDMYYQGAQDEIYAEWSEYIENAYRKTEQEQRVYDDAVENGDKEAIAIALFALTVARKKYLLEDKNAKAMKSDIVSSITSVNQGALSFLNSQKTYLYKINYNQVSYNAHKAGLPFQKLNDRTVKMVANKTVANKVVNVAKDTAWNMKKINSAILQGINNGESMRKIAKRLEPILDNNKSSAMRTARTKVTEIENRARLESYKTLEKMGGIVKKRWLATGDGRTRDWHVDMDGQTVKLDEPFRDGLGNTLDYPGDGGGSPETVYNCRCSMEEVIEGVRKEDGSIEYFDSSEEPSLHDIEMQNERERRGL